jgi:hypothetical protein
MSALSRTNNCFVTVSKEIEKLVDEATESCKRSESRLMEQLSQLAPLQRELKALKKEGEDLLLEQQR